jgi:cytidylate kinase
MNPFKEKVPVITIDGPSGTGKGTVCLMLAEHLGWHLLDSGAIYRVLAYAAQAKQVNVDDVPNLVTIAKTMDLKFAKVTDQTVILLNDIDITAAVRNEECGQNASKIAVLPEVRNALLDKQRQFAQLPGLVTDGRDMGTVVFPDANIKLYLFATAEERAQRRYLQLKNSKNDVSLAQVVEELEKRDARDSARTISPLRPAQDAVLIDTTKLTVVQVFDNVLQLVEKALSTGKL